MGRTNPTYRNFLESQEQEWRDFRRALRHQYKRDYDRLFEYAEHYADAAGFLSRADPERAILLSMLLGVEAERRRLEERVAALEDGREAATETGREDGQDEDPEDAEERRC